MEWHGPSLSSGLPTYGFRLWLHRKFTSLPLEESPFVRQLHFGHNVFQHKCFTAIHKHYTFEQWVDFGNNNKDVLGFVAASSGTSDSDWDKLQKVLGQFPEVRSNSTKVYLLCLIKKTALYFAMIGCNITEEKS
ncbi:GMP reductase 2 [Portunus trituberculatus]|uniref:GMP reductase 2 n=1 Tax=Portunus trituberculatus TaxID=210409 RepID=A0A5B7DEM8_PORTR|nr:GMP reductase 2 [Portunus trituberculatus]